jgi:hypothetical protein
MKGGDEEVNLTNIYFIYYCKCHNALSLQY